MMSCGCVCYIQFLVMTSIGSMNFSKNEETTFWLEVDNLYDGSDVDRNILVKSFEKEKLLKHFYHCTEQEIISELCVQVMNKVTQASLKRTHKLEKVLSPKSSIRNSEVFNNSLKMKFNIQIFCLSTTFTVNI